MEHAPGADLTLTKTGPAEVLLLSQFEYKLEVTNKGPDAASSVGVQDVLPLEVRFVSVNATQGTCSGTEAVSCALGTLAPGHSAEVTIRVRAVVTGTARNSATVASGQLDPTPADNAAVATTAIKTQPGVPREPSATLPCKITVTTDYIFRGLVTFVGVSVTRDGVPLAGVKVYSKHSWHSKITNTRTNRFGYTEYHFLTRTPGGTVEFVADCDRNGLRPASVRNLRTYGAGKSAHAQEPADISYSTGLKETTQLSRVTPFVGSGQRMPLRSPAAKANCQSVRVSTSNLRARNTGSVTVQVFFAGRPVKTAAVVLDGAAGRQVKATGLSGQVVFKVRPAKSGSIQVRVPNFAACSSVATLAVAP